MESNGRRLVILSDTHLGHPKRGARSAQALRSLWRGADHLIINGDAAEMHDPTCRGAAAREILRMQRMCEEEDVELTLLPGNHDPMISDRRFVRLFGGEVFITHGDVLHPAISPWNSNRAELQQLHDQAIAALEPPLRRQMEAQLSAAQFASHFEWDHMANHPEPQIPLWRKATEQAAKVARAIWYWHTLPQAAARYARRHAPDCRYFIFGHIHHSGIWNIDQRTIINTGSYGFPSKPLAVVVQDRVLAVWPILTHERGYQLGPKPLRQFTLQCCPAAV